MSLFKDFVYISFFHLFIILEYHYFMKETGMLFFFFNYKIYKNVNISYVNTLFIFLPEISHSIN